METVLLGSCKAHHGNRKPRSQRGRGRAGHLVAEFVSRYHSWPDSPICVRRRPSRIDDRKQITGMLRSGLRFSNAVTLCWRQTGSDRASAPRVTRAASTPTAYRSGREAACRTAAATWVARLAAGRSAVACTPRRADSRARRVPRLTSLPGIRLRPCIHCSRL